MRQITYCYCPATSHWTAEVTGEDGYPGASATADSLELAVGTAINDDLAVGQLLGLRVTHERGSGVYRVARADDETCYVVAAKLCSAEFGSLMLRSADTFGIIIKEMTVPACD
jgi:hypothetical protein